MTVLDIMEEEKREILRQILIENFKKVGNCIEWTGKTNQGYGYIHIFKKTWFTHRLSYILEKGEIPEGFYVLHSCNNKKCFNPRHIYAGNAKENREDLENSEYFEDILEKQIQKRKDGYEYKNNHLPETEFLSIEEVAKIFGVHPNTIRLAVRKGHIIAIRIGDGIRSPYRISRKSIDDIHELIIKQHREKGKK